MYEFYILKSLKVQHQTHVKTTRNQIYSLMFNYLYKIYNKYILLYVDLLINSPFIKFLYKFKFKFNNKLLILYLEELILFIHNNFIILLE